MVATPIGNLRDITLRALDVLRSVDLVAAEDTRHTRRLLDHHGISAKLLASHEHNERGAGERIVAALAAGHSVALVTDAGTPAISDPGSVVVRCARVAGFAVVPVPGASAAIAAMSAAGLDETGFLFLGFLPSRTDARRRMVETFAVSVVPVVLYEAPHRIRESLTDLLAVLGAQRRVTVCRELTKLFESIHEIALGDAVEWLDADANRERGEFVLVVHAAIADDTVAAREASRILALLTQDLPASQAAKLAARIIGGRRNELYAEALRLKPEPEENE